MNTQRIRLALIVAMAVASLAIVIGSPSSQGQGGGNAPRIEGSWLITVTLDGGGFPPFPALVTYAGGGALVAVDAGGPPSVNTSSHGTWVRKGDHKFAWTFLQFFFDPITEAFAGYFRVHSVDTLDKDSQVLNSRVTVDVLDPAGNVVGSFGGTTHGTRISAE